jgi:aspartyl-tRNA(Asn)/glutamyl-tRNA(Gln) amidotransferase subunit A
MKPTWGRISRYGLFPFAPSLDHVGYFTRDVYASAVLLDVLAGRDNHDSTSSTKPVEHYEEKLGQPVKGMKIAVLQRWSPIRSKTKNQNPFLCLARRFEETRRSGGFCRIRPGFLESFYATYIVISCAEATSERREPGWD